MKLKQTLISLVSSIVMLGTGMNTSTALDTDIYYLDPSASTTLVKPNLVLILDTSGSMNENVSGTTQMRVDVMKQAMLSVLDEMGDVNVGLMRFSHDAGGPVVYPVKNLETVITDTGNIQVVVQDSQDDAEQTVSGGSVNTTSSTLYLHTNAGAERQVGIRFRNTYIPQGVTITSAKIVFKAGSDDSDTVNLKIRADKVPDAPIYTATTSNISGRTQTTAGVDWSVGAWTADNFYETPDLTSVVQEVVSQTDWCRGNAIALTFKRNGAATGQRRARAYDTYNNNGFAAPEAALVVTYDPATVPTTSSCHQVVKRVNQGTDDAEQRQSNGGMTLTGSLQLIRATNDQYVGVRFQNLGIPQNATITSATLEFEVDSTSTTATSLTIRGEASGNASTFTSTTSNISGRGTTTASVSWSSVPNLAVNQKLVSPDIKGIVQEIVNLGGWASGNAMAFIISGSGTKNVESYDSEPAAAPLLRVKYSANTATQKTVREQLKEFVVAMRAESNTPIVDALYEAALYYRGGDMDYGKKRDGQSGTRARWTRVSHPESYTGGTLSTPAGCTYADPDSANCVTEEITGSAVYTTPIAYSCQSNHIILLTDGAANGNNSAAKIITMTGISTCSDSGDEECGVSLASFLHTEDQSSLGTLQTVATHTIGINISNTFLSDLASNGGGFYKTANDANDVIAAFNSILNEVLKNPTSFVSPSLSVNAFNRLYNRDEVYFTLFSPQLSVGWPGNLKKYKLCATSTCTYGEVMDASSPPVSAIDSTTSKIKTTATSYWSNPGDGPEVQVGGAGAKVTSYSGRRAYTYTGTSDAPGTSVDISTSSHVVTTGNAAITQAMLGAASSTERDAIINWMRGQDLEDEDSDSVTNEIRWPFADALHSRPSTIGYGGTVASPAIKIIVGTNDGGVRMIDAASGEEDWIVYLPEFLLKQKDLKDNSNGIHIPGVDGSPTLRIVDNNNDGIIDPTASDKVQLFIGMRRGGKYLYAFDLTPDTSPLTTSSAIGTIKPKFMWRISNSSTDFGVLGQTWSRPLLTKVWVKCPTGDSSCQSGVSGQKDSKIRTVLLFGGGYDVAFDSKLGGSGEGMGNAIFMVDPDTGSRLWWAGGTSSGADLELSNMKYSIPSDLALLDSDRDGATDRIYVGDVHGQLWRIDLSNQNDPDAASANARNGGADATVGYVFADIGCGNSVDGDVGSRASNCSATTNQNRLGFFYPPDVAQIEDDVYASSGNTIYDYVTIGTGDREDPLDKKTQAVSQGPVHNRIYAFRDPNTKLGPPMVGTTVTIPSALTESNLHNADANALSNTSGAGYAAALSDIQSKKGWFINLKEASPTDWIGEKVLARTTIFAGVLYVTTYIPPQTGGTPTACGAPAEGTAKAYELNLLNASGVYTTSGDRSAVIGGGIPSELVIVIREGGTSTLIGTSSGAKSETLPPQTPHRTYWYQE